MKNMVVIIPSYKPDKEIMSKFINELKREFKSIIIVNDGSGDEYNDYFSTFEELDIPVLKHCVNMGKGRAIKTAFNYICNNYPEFECAVTADCDGQHTVEDIKKCLIEAKENPSKLILGVRNFDQKDVPFKSKYGNKITKNIFKIFIGINISDTQTGLRGFTRETINKFINTLGERYEYETNMLIDCKLHNIEIKEVPIKTIYINNNKTSHFNPIKDSIMIYKLFFKYILSSLSSFIVDIVLFSLFNSIFSGIIKNNILISTIISRTSSSMYNYLLNARLIFKNKNKSTLIKYIILVIIQMFVSGYTVTLLSELLHNTSTVIIKVLVDAVIFVINFIIQREWVFKQNKN